MNSVAYNAMIVMSVQVVSKKCNRLLIFGLYTQFRAKYVQQNVRACLYKLSKFCPKNIEKSTPGIEMETSKFA